MEFYITLFIIVAVAASFDFSNISTNKKNIIFILILTMCIIISSIRWNNPDWDVYYPFFMKNNDLDDFLYGDIPIDKGFGLINFCIKFLFDDFTALLSVLALVIISIKGWFIKKYSYFPLVSLLLWFGVYIGDMFFNRQTLAISITMISFYFIVHKRVIPFVICVIIAASVQVSVIAFLLAYPIYHWKISRLYMVLGIGLSIVVGMYLDNSYLIEIAGLVNLIDVDTQRLLTKIDTYIQESRDSNYILVYARRLIFIPLELYVLSKMEKINEYFRGSVNLIVFGYMIYFLLINVSNTFATRISSPFYIYEMMVLPNIIYYFKNINMRVIGFIVLVIYAYVKYIYALNLYPECYIPYVNILW